ncbi:protein FAM240B-like isoform X3 [Hemicordylus capensis]|uniref:protein FAM240B-like isoform X3 n=1 Tax=Hemicordylus capensis TaxID=884348 RepID=UPI00230213D7|nr:protein FAM240B-like isoform X3 [Hemicordylus capensis]
MMKDLYCPPPPPTSNKSTEEMNSQYFRLEVLACETGELKNFWEKTIEKQTQYLEAEKDRKQKSALTKLRNEWKERMEQRIKMLNTPSEDEEAPN